MHKLEALSDRIDALEARATHQDKTLEELNGIVTDQWKQIERLTRQVARLEEQVQDLRASAGPGGEEPPPPHY